MLNIKKYRAKREEWPVIAVVVLLSDDSDEEEEYEEEEEEGNERAGKFNKKAPRSKAGCKRADACKVCDRHDPFGANVFKRGHATQPKKSLLCSKNNDQQDISIDRSSDPISAMPHLITPAHAIATVLS
ncbi:hypothetical protein HAX54_010899, partial [Datura stramonium]|nr:hypothetical protein [Datura stramonium]